MSLAALRARLAARRQELTLRRVVVLAGGGSAEREVSLRSGQAMADALRSSGFAAELALVPATFPYLQLTTGLSLAAGQSISVDEGGAAVPALMQRIDEAAAPLVLSALHGTHGEDGTWQGLLELLGLPYASAGVKGSAVAMDKVLTKRVMRDLGIPTPRNWKLTDGAGWDVPGDVTRLVAKPASQGSSVGVKLIGNDAAGLEAARELSREFGAVLIEEFIAGRELTQAIIGRQAELVSLPLVEICPREGFYDYDNKYTAGASDYVCPAEVDAALAGAIGRDAVLLYRELELAPMARFDVLLAATGSYWFLEANTLPGFTSTSLLPKAAQAAGIEYTELLELLLLCALERWEARREGSP